MEYIKEYINEMVDIPGFEITCLSCGPNRNPPTEELEFQLRLTSTFFINYDNYERYVGEAAVGKRYNTIYTVKNLLKKFNEMLHKLNIMPMKSEELSLLWKDPNQRHQLPHLDNNKKYKIISLHDWFRLTDNEKLKKNVFVIKDSKNFTRLNLSNRDILMYLYNVDNYGSKCVHNAKGFKAMGLPLGTLNTATLDDFEFLMKTFKLRDFSFRLAQRNVDTEFGTRLGHILFKKEE